MSSEYEKLLKTVIKLNSKSGEKCLICHFPDEIENLVKLKCGHYFHSNCLNMNNKLTCPYCGKKIKIIENIQKTKCNIVIANGTNKGKLCGRINCKYHKNNIVKENTEKIKKCQSIIKSGPRKGEKCNRVNCFYHKTNKAIIV